MRRLTVAAVAAAVGLEAGCASTWETVSSNEFKKAPLGTMFKSDDPLHTLRTSPEGGKRAAAMLALKEPLKNGGTQAEQDEVVTQILGPAATSDPFPVVRAAAIDALGRYDDPRAPQLLTAAFQQATGRSADAPPPPPAPEPLQPASAGRAPTKNLDPTLRPRFGLGGPTGFPDDVVAMLRGKALDGLARANTPEAVAFVQQVATTPKPGDPADAETRIAAVRALGAMNAPAAGQTLQAVYEKEKGQNIALAGRAREGMHEQTGGYPEGPKPEAPLTVPSAPPPAVTAGGIVPNGVVDTATPVKPAGFRR